MNGTPQGLPPHSLVQPTPLGWAIDRVPGPDGHPAVVVRVESPTGSAVFILNPTDAEKIGRDLVATAGGTQPLVVPTIDLSEFRSAP